MKLINKLLFCAALICFVLCACQKEYNPEDNTNPPSTTVDSNYLSKFYEIDFDGVSYDTTDIWTYTYDDQKRVIKLHDSMRYYTPGMYEDYQYFYHGNDTLPYKAIYISFQDVLAPIDTLVSFFTYDVQGRRTKDSSIGAAIFSFAFGAGVTFYDYQNDKVYCNNTERFYSQVSGAYEYIYHKDTGTIINNRLVQNNYSNNYEYQSRTYFTYDDHPSPFARLSNFKTWAVVNIEEIFFYEIPQLNNITKIRTEEYYSGSLTRVMETDFTGGFTYNAAGYPTKMVYENGSRIVSLVYKSL
jgi:hypothetical protein